MKGGGEGGGVVPALVKSSGSPTTSAKYRYSYCLQGRVQLLPAGSGTATTTTTTPPALVALRAPEASLCTTPPLVMCRAAPWTWQWRGRAGEWMCGGWGERGGGRAEEVIRATACTDQYGLTEASGDSSVHCAVHFYQASCCSHTGYMLQLPSQRATAAEAICCSFSAYISYQVIIIDQSPKP